MKYTLILVIILYHSLAFGQHFRVQKFNFCKALNNHTFLTQKPNIIKRYYKIIWNNNSWEFNRYDPYNSLPGIKDTIAVIEELLNFEGDDRICFYKPTWLNTEHARWLHSAYPDKYSLQLEALIIINQIYFNDSYKYSPYPLIVRNPWEFESVSGELIKIAYHHYKMWFEKVKKLGLSKARKRNIRPLDGAPVSWFYSDS